MEPEFIEIKEPVIHPSVFVGTGSQIVGDVRIHKDASIWYNVVLRGDIATIEVGEGSNIQDGSVIHVDFDGPCIIGRNVVVGHHANLHGCIVEDACLIGIGAIVLSRAIIRKGSVIAAGSVVKEGTIVESGTLMAGVPAKPVRKNLQHLYLQKNKEHAEFYVKLARAYKKEFLRHNPEAGINRN